MATYAVSDIHGYYSLFIKGLEKIGFSDEDKLYVIGDAIDRGPDGIKLLCYIKDHENMDLILGNHEYMMLNSLDGEGNIGCTGPNKSLWLVYNGGKYTYDQYKSLSFEERKDLLKWLNSRYVIKTLKAGEKKICLTHSYYIEECENKIYSDLNQEFVWSVVWKSMFRLEPELSVPDIYRYYDYTFITGHVPVYKARPRWYGEDVVSEEEANVLEPLELEDFMNIDGGCAAGFWPSLNNGLIFVRLEDLKSFPVPMKCLEED